MFKHIKENQIFYKTYFKLKFDTNYAISSFQFYDDLASKFYDNKYIDYHIEFFRSGFNAIIKKWLAGGCKESPEEMDRIIRSEYQGRIQK